MGPVYPGRGECAKKACETVQYVWSHNPAALVGIAVCVLALWLWVREVRPSLDTGEEDSADQR